MDELVIRIIEAGGYWGIVFLMALENIIPPVPSEVIMGIGGLLVERGAMDFWPLLFWGTVGSTGGNYVLFWISDKHGAKRLKPFVDRWGRWLTVEWEEVEKGRDFLRKHGHWVVFALRFSPFLRSVISIPAGLAQMPHWKFLAFTFVGAGIWNVLLIKGGQWLGRYLSESQDVLGWIIVGMFVLTIVAYFWRLFTWEPSAKTDAEKGAAGKAD